VRERIVELIEARREAYSRASVTIDTSDISVEEAADATITKFAEYAKGSWAASA
jgi:hypothetical protein